MLKAPTRLSAHFDTCRCLGCHFAGVTVQRPWREWRVSTELGKRAAMHDPHWPFMRCVPALRPHTSHEGRQAPRLLTGSTRAVHLVLRLPYAYIYPADAS